MLIAPIFWLPPVASGILLWATWSTGLLRRPWLALASFLVALYLQFSTLPYTPVWAVGIALQVALGVRLAVVWRLG